MENQQLPAATVCRLTRRQVISGGAILGGFAFTARPGWGRTTEEISRDAEAIHQEPVFKAARARVYAALTDAAQFNKVVLLSAAMQSGMKLGNNPTEITAVAGSAFSLFGGYVSGRQIELVPNERIVQAWRAGGWGPGAYSIARFDHVEDGSGTRIVFDHLGFPRGQAQHLAAGWKVNYWEPLEKFLA